ncbi:lysophospholipid acyltransferase family protein [Alkalimarinus sediminis]|uniref:1-acyl-sn-glycerol-3-phosphate acyltransferase n=1 Tax=Alkalimarinus sediminis TaxID=1632866 RepID=A0A9E8HET1_9ALTE|nr:lysophospholipid acyltransferase family protein [Alkalimarinus sediminis]UZW73318.1 1-acyl-sn-glycerol-3-phosphate acyltransferase [Alkalimarinus sediminis]
MKEYNFKTSLVIKSAIFHTGCNIGLLIHCCSTLLIAPLLNVQQRQYIFTRYNVFVLWWCKVVCGVYYEIKGEENIPKGPCIILSNHQSSWETFLFQTMFSPLSTVLKKELLKVPLFGWAMRLLEPIALDRSQPVQAFKQLISQGHDRVSANRSVLIFPEGTRVAIGEKVKFNRGGAALAHHSQTPIVPVAHNAGLCVPKNSFILTPGKITIKIGTPIYSEGKSKKELYDLSTQWIESNRDAMAA